MQWVRSMLSLGAGLLLVGSGCRTTEQIGLPLEVLDDTSSGFAIEQLPSLSRDEVDDFQISDDGATALAWKRGRASNGGGVYVVDPNRGELSRSGMVGDSQSIADATFTFTDRFALAAVWLCPEGIHASDSAGYLCDDLDGNSELHLYDPDSSSWKQLEVPGAGGVHFERIGDRLYFYSEGRPSDGGAFPVMSLDLPDGSPVMEHDLVVQGLEQIYERLDEVDEDMQPEFGRRNATSGLTLAAGLEDEWQTDVVSDDGRLMLRNVSQAVSTDLGVFVTDQKGDRYRITANGQSGQ